MSLERLDAGLIPRPAEWVKDPALLQLHHSSQLWLGSDSWPRSAICHQAPKEGKKEQKEKDTAIELSLGKINMCSNI